MDKLLAWWGEIKKYKHGEACCNQQKHFSPFVVSVDGILVKEVPVVLATLSQLMDVKIDKHTLHITGWVNGRIAIAVVRS